MTQIEYIETLFNDCGFNYISKQEWLKSKFGVGYSDELARQDLFNCIDILRNLKQEHKKERKIGKQLRFDF